MTEPVFGMTIIRGDSDAQVVVAPDMSIIGILGTAPGADSNAVPLNFPVLGTSGDADFLASLGTDGTIPDALQSIQAQVGDLQGSAMVVVVRVTPGASDQETIQNLLGSATNQTGMWAFKMAGDELAVIPRIIIVPGFTHQSLNALDSVHPNAVGAGYVSAPAVTFSGGGSAPGKVLPTAHAVLGTGADAGKVMSYVVDTPGVNITAALAVAVGAPPGGGTQATATAIIDVTSNAICAALSPVLESLLAHAIVEGPGTTKVAAQNWRETLNSQRLIPIDCWIKKSDGVSVFTRPGAPCIAGIAARRDYEFRGAPMHSWANQPIQGIVGLVRKVQFSLTDGTTEGQQLLADNIGIATRGELGVESAIASSGFVFIGTDVATDDTLWQFYNVTRGRDYIHIGILKTERYYLGRYNITTQTVRAILNTMDDWLGSLMADQNLLGYKVGFEGNKNSPENIRLGRIRVYFAAEEPPPLRRIDVDSRRYRQALVNLVDVLVAEADQIGAIR